MPVQAPRNTAPLGIDHINKMLYLDYASDAPAPVFRIEMDIPLGAVRDLTVYDQLKALLDLKRSKKTDQQIARILVKLLPKTGVGDPPPVVAQKDAARRLVFAAFGVEPSAPKRKPRATKAAAPRKRAAS